MIDTTHKKSIESGNKPSGIWSFKKRDLILYCAAIAIWLVSMLLFTDFSKTFTDFWYFIPFGIVAATIAMSTPAGGGIAFFPVLIRTGLTPQEVVAFAFATQTVGMGFGSIRWMIEDLKTFQWKVAFSTIPGGWLGLYIGLFLLPIQNERLVRLVFSFAGLSLCILTLFFYYRRNDNNDDLTIKLPHITGFFIVGIIGGVITSYIGFGVDLCIFFYIVLFFNYSLRSGTVTSIFIIALTVPFGFFLHTHFLDTLRWEFWQMVIPGILTGAIIGPKLHLTIGLKKMMYGLCILLFLEFIVTVFFRM